MNCDAAAAAAATAAAGAAADACFLRVRVHAWLLMVLRYITPLCVRSTCIHVQEDTQELRVSYRDMYVVDDMLLPMSFYGLSPRQWTQLTIGALLGMAALLFVLLCCNRRRRRRAALTKDE